MVNVDCCGIVCWTLRHGGMLALEALAWHAMRRTFASGGWDVR